MELVLGIGWQSSSVTRGHCGPSIPRAAGTDLHQVLTTPHPQWNVFTGLANSI